MFRQSTGQVRAMLELGKATTANASDSLRRCVKSRFSSVRTASISIDFSVGCVLLTGYLQFPTHSCVIVRLSPIISRTTSEKNRTTDQQPLARVNRFSNIIILPIVTVCRVSTFPCAFYLCSNTLNVLVSH